MRFRFKMRVGWLSYISQGPWLCIFIMTRALTLQHGLCTTHLQGTLDAHVGQLTAYQLNDVSKDMLKKIKSNFATGKCEKVILNLLWCTGPMKAISQHIKKQKEKKKIK